MNREGNLIENKTEKVGFRFIVERVEKVKDALLSLSELPQTARVVLDSIHLSKKQMLNEAFDDGYNKDNFFQYLGSYITGLKNVVSDDGVWGVLPEYIPPDADTLARYTRILSEVNDPDIYSKGISAEQMAIEVAENKSKIEEKLKGIHKNTLRLELRKYIDELMHLSLEGVSRATDTIQ